MLVHFYSLVSSSHRQEVLLFQDPISCHITLDPHLSLAPLSCDIIHISLALDEPSTFLFRSGIL